jgi:hypothetical protein
MQADILLACLKQRGHMLLAQPNVLIFQANVDLHLLIFAAIDKELALGLGEICGITHDSRPYMSL